MYKWTRAAQIHVVQASTVQSRFLLCDMGIIMLLISEVVKLKKKHMMLLSTMSGTQQVLHINAYHFYLETQNNIIQCSRHRVL